MLTTDAKKRKDIPVYSGFIAYFPDAIAEVALLSKAGNDQHNPGKPLHWDRSKSGDELDALTRHLIDGTSAVGSLDDAILAARAVAWRGMANLQKLCEQRDFEKQSRRGADDGDWREGTVWSQEDKREENVHTQMRASRLRDDDGLDGPVGSY